MHKSRNFRQDVQVQLIKFWPEGSNVLFDGGGGGGGGMS